MITEEMQQVIRLLLRKSQMESFGPTYQALAAGKPMAASDHLNKLSPFMDEQNLMRLRGRLRHADASYEMKHPILLSAKHPIVRKLIEDAHESNYHEGTEYVRSVLQQNYWIIGLRNALRNVKLKCVKCRKQQVGGVQPFMADLPKERLEERVFPFANTGVDYFGPFEVRFMRKSMKRWCCLFTCLTTRAVHVEVVPSLEADACLTAITRFIARRGKPNIILSDNGTNFVGAAREMREWIEAWNQSDIEQSLAQKQIKWKFNPPGAPHFGGVWERMVRSCKKAMMAIVGNRTLTDDVLFTTMCLVEQILNSRPLTSVSDDPEDLEALTPNHFLLGRASPATAFIPDAQRYTDLRRVFRVSQAYADMIWSRWNREYLPQWNERSKWNKEEVRQLEVNDLVWIVDENVKRAHYKMGRVLEVYTGSDGRVRSALVKTEGGKLKRPVVKLAPLFYESVFREKNRAGNVGASQLQDQKLKFERD